MATIDQDLAAIRTAILGKDVREAIADGIEHCYNDGNAAANRAKAAAQNAETAINTANAAAASVDASKQAAASAATAANTAAANADKAKDAANTAASGANAAKDAANTAAGKANTAATGADEAAAEAVKIATEAGQAAQKTADDAAADATKTADDAAKEAVRIANEAAAAAKKTAEDAAADAEEKETGSEAWARGTRMGKAVPQTDPTCRNNSYFYAMEAKTANSTTQANTQKAMDYRDEAKAWAEAAQQGADASGYIICDVNDEDGMLYIDLADRLDEQMKFEIDESIGMLEVIING